MHTRFKVHIESTNSYCPITDLFFLCMAKLNHPTKRTFQAYIIMTSQKIMVCSIPEEFLPLRRGESLLCLLKSTVHALGFS